MPSQRYQVLVEHLSHLRHHLLPDPFLPTGNYGDLALVHTQAAAYAVLAHAEFEAYFEDRAVEIAIAARDIFTTTARVCRPVVCLLGFIDGASKRPAAQARPASLDEVDIKSRVKFAANTFIKYVKEDNNGIREKHLTKVLMPIGFAYFDFDSVILSGFNTLATRRGQYAHASRAGYVTQGLDPQALHNEVISLISGTTNMDAHLDRLLAETT